MECADAHHPSEVYPVSPSFRRWTGLISHNGHVPWTTHGGRLITVAVDTGPQRTRVAAASGSTIDGPGGDITIVRFPKLIEVHYSVPPSDHVVHWLNTWLDTWAAGWRMTSLGFTRDAAVGILTFEPPA